MPLLTQEAEAVLVGEVKLLAAALLLAALIVHEVVDDALLGAVFVTPVGIPFVGVGLGVADDEEMPGIEGAGEEGAEGVDDIAQAADGVDFEEVDMDAAASQDGGLCVDEVVAVEAPAAKVVDADAGDVHEAGLAEGFCRAVIDPQALGLAHAGAVVPGGRWVGDGGVAGGFDLGGKGLVGVLGGGAEGEEPQGLQRAGGGTGEVVIRQGKQHADGIEIWLGCAAACAMDFPEAGGVHEGCPVLRAGAFGHELEEAGDGDDAGDFLQTRAADT